MPLRVFDVAVAAYIHLLSLWWYLSFTIDVESVFGEKRTVELIPNGKDKVVTYENRMEYIERYIDYVFNTNILKKI